MEEKFELLAENFIKKIKLNVVLREKYLRLQQEEKEFNGGAGRRITQKKIASKVGVSNSFISLWLSEKRSLELETLDKLAMVLLEEQALLEGRKNEKKQ